MFNKILGLIFLSFIISSPAFSGPPPFCYQEEDGSPSGCFKKIKFANGTITDNGDGTYSHSQAGAGGGDITDVGPDCSSGGCFVDGANDRLVFEGSTADTVESTLGAKDPTSGDQTFNLPDMAAGGTYTLATTPIFFDDSDTTGNVTYVGCSDSIASAITAATDGDTLNLGACTYSLSAALTINKALSIVGTGNTVLNFGSTSDIDAISVTADNVTFRNLKMQGTDVHSGVTVSCVAGTVCNNVNFLNVSFQFSNANNALSGAVRYEDAGGLMLNPIIITSSYGSTSEQIQNIFKKIVSTAEADTTLYIINPIIRSTNLNAAFTGQHRGIMNWNNGADESTQSGYAYIYNPSVTLIPASSSSTEDMEASQSQGARIYTNNYGGFYDSTSLNTLASSAIRSENRCDDGAVCQYYATVMATGNTDSSVATDNLKRGIIWAAGIDGVAALKGRNSSATVSNAIKAINLTGPEGGDSTGTGSRTGGKGGGSSITAGAGGVANSANTASTGGAAGDFDLIGGVGGAASVGTGTNTGGKGSTFNYSTGTGGAAASGTTNTGGAGGDFNITLGAGGAGSTAAGAAGTFKLIGTGFETYSLSYESPVSAEMLRLTSSTTSNLMGLEISSGTAGDARFYVRADTDDSAEGDSPEIRLIQDGGTVTHFLKGEGTAGTVSTNTLADYLIIGSEDNLGVQFVTNDALRMTILNNGLIGIGTNAPTNTLSFSGEAARKIWMEDELTAETAGRDLTIQAGGSGAGTDDSGGNLNLASGSAVGNNGSVLNIQTVATGQGTGTTARTPGTSSTFGGAAASAYLDLGTALGVRLSTDGDGALTFLGIGAGNDEDLTWNFDDTANQVDVSTSTGVTSVEFNSIDLIVPTEAYDEAGWNADTSVPTKDAVRDKIESLSLGAGAPTDADYLVGTANGSLSAEIVVGTSPGGELGGTWASPTIDDSLTVTGWVLGTFSGTTGTVGTMNIDLLDGVGAVDMDYGSADITDHTFTTDGTGTAEIVLPAGAIDSTEILDDTILEADLKAVDAASDEECLTYETTTGDFEWQTCGSGSDTNAQKEYVWPASATLPLEAADSIPPIGKDAGTNIDQLYVAFDSAADECRSVNFKVPSDVTSGTVTFRVNWYSAAATSGAAAWDFRHNSGVTTGTDPDQSLTLEFIESDTTAGTAGQLNIASGTETIANLGWSANEQVDGVFCRDGNGTNGTDDLTGDALAVQFSIEIPRA